jgi:hypothetical protein
MFKNGRNCMEKRWKKPLFFQRISMEFMENNFSDYKFEILEQFEFLECLICKYFVFVYGWSVKTYTYKKCFGKGCLPVCGSVFLLIFCRIARI